MDTVDGFLFFGARASHISRVYLSLSLSGDVLDILHAITAIVCGRS